MTFSSLQIRLALLIILLVKQSYGIDWERLRNIDSIIERSQKRRNFRDLQTSLPLTNTYPMNFKINDVHFNQSENEVKNPYRYPSDINEGSYELDDNYEEKHQGPTIIQGVISIPFTAAHPWPLPAPGIKFGGNKDHTADHHAKDSHQLHKILRMHAT